MAVHIGKIVAKLVDSDERVRNLRLVGFDEQSRRGFTLVPNYLFDLQISSTAKLLYAYLLHCAWNKGYAFPSQQAAADKLRVTRKTVRSYFVELKKAGLLRPYRRGWGMTNVYVLYCKPIKGQARQKNT